MKNVRPSAHMGLQILKAFYWNMYRGFAWAWVPYTFGVSDVLCSTIVPLSDPLLLHSCHDYRCQQD
eukprot:6337559-Amphidinium_carterae.1